MGIKQGVVIREGRFGKYTHRRFMIAHAQYADHILRGPAGIVLPSLVVAVVWRNMFDSQYGAINQGLSSILHLFGGNPVTVRWLEEVDPIIGTFGTALSLPLSYFALLICNIWLGWPFMTIVATGALGACLTILALGPGLGGGRPHR